MTGTNEVRPRRGASARRARAQTPSEDLALAQQILAGNAEAFQRLARANQAGLLRVAESVTGSRAVAEEVVQETWAAVGTSLGQYEGRAALRTWLYRITANIATARARKERAEPEPLEDASEAKQQARFAPNGSWSDPPAPWSDGTPEQMVMRKQLVECIQAVVQALPRLQQAVITLHDMQDFDTEDVCSILEITAVHQRVLLHRARTRVRFACEEYYREAS